MLLDCFPKLNSETEKCILLAFKMPLTTENLAMAPHQVDAAFQIVAQLDNAAAAVEIASEFEGVGAEFFGVPDQTKPNTALVAATFRKLEVRRAEKGEVALFFNTTIPWANGLWKWAGEMLGCTVFAEFHVTQPMLPMATPASFEGITQHPDAAQEVAEIAPDRKTAAAGDGPKRRGRPRKSEEVAEPAVQ